MNKKITTIVYQVPLALPDVYEWAAKNKFHLEHGAYGPYHYEVNKEEEFISLIPIGNIDDVPRCDKLVLWGAFDVDELATLIDYMQREE